MMAFLVGFKKSLLLAISIEEEIKLNQYVENVMIFGMNKPYNIALVIPDFEVLKRYAKSNNLPQEPEALIKEDKIKALIEKEIQNALKGRFGNYEIPKKIILLTDNFTTENKMLTQTLKLKRREVVKKYGDVIETLY